MARKENMISDTRKNTGVECTILRDVGYFKIRICLKI